MATLMMRASCRDPQVHQKNWGGWLARQWRGWRVRRVRRRYRDELIDLADNPHLLEDIGVTREEALEAAGKPSLIGRDRALHSSHLTDRCLETNQQR